MRIYLNITIYRFNLQIEIFAKITHQNKFKQKGDEEVMT